MTDLITVENLTCAYDSEDVLKEISLHVKEKDVIFLMGNNGSGKTTLLNCLLNNLFIKQGNIYYEGRNINIISKEKFAKLVAFVPQNFNTACEFKVKDYLVLGRNPYIRLGNPKKSDYLIVEKYAEQTGVVDILNKSFNSLSGGQKQWVTITKAMVQETKIMIMDEPMSALDFGKQGELLLLLYELNKQGKTIVLTSHNPNHCFCIPVAKVCMIDAGIIQAFGTPKSIFNEEMIKRIYGKNVCLNRNGKIDFCLR